ncbi:hypothetical protein [Nodularia sp. UHCC 0506]|uniref:hypothetical protein n=1 Tax=Nodularia sp. UHCC 0506 TaxID=3110243 RepID=UPI002B201DF8|nr:hypothetical protein [Nodularia sp. UHCC 0506]MEA5513854.1 hypothetical protein [Nodularia sp. UHCC 0506]
MSILPLPAPCRFGHILMDVGGIKLISIKIFLTLKNLSQGFLLPGKQMIEYRQSTGKSENNKF